MMLICETFNAAYVFTMHINKKWGTTNKNKVKETKLNMKNQNGTSGAKTRQKKYNLSLKTKTRQCKPNKKNE